MKTLNKNILFYLILLSNSVQSLISREIVSQIPEDKIFVTTPLHKSIVRHYFNKTKKMHVIKELLDEGFNVNARNENLRTPLWLTTFYGGNIDIINLLIKYGADVTIPDMFNVTPLHNAIKRNDMEVAECLFNAAMMINQKTAEKMVNFKDDRHRTPFDTIQIDGVSEDLLHEILNDNNK